MDPRPALADDARHPLLSRARVAGQLALDERPDAPWTPRPPAQPGGYRVLEVEARTALTPFGMGHGWSLNPYAGCSHACLYCYVPDVTRVERPRWGSYTIVKWNLPQRLAREVRRKPRDEVFLSSATDPYQPAEGHARITRRCLDVLAGVDWPLRVLTRSPLVARDRDLLRAFTQVRVGLSVPTLDDQARRLIEPSAPPVAARLRTLRRLADAGLHTFVSFAPAYPLSGGHTPDSIADAFGDAGVRLVQPGAWRYLAGIGAALDARVRGTPFADWPLRVADPAAYRRLLAGLGAACRRRGIAFEPYGGPDPRRGGPPSPAALRRPDPSAGSRLGHVEHAGLPQRLVDGDVAGLG